MNKNIEKKPTILVVEDSEIDRKILVRMFRDKYNIIEATNGKEAIENVHANENISCILLDLIMPIMDGFDVLLELKNDFAYSNIPIIVITTDLDTDSEIKVLDYGADDFCLKPFKAEIVRLKVKNLVDKFVLEKIYRSRFDPLTGLFNAENFYKATELLLDKNKDSENGKFAIIITNIEKFKVINELFDTDVGDRVLIQMAELIKRDIKKIGIYGRLELDNFIMCVPIKYIDVAKFKKQSEYLTKILDLNYSIRLSYGIYIINDMSLGIAKMCDRAKMALNTVTGNYVNNLAFYNDDLRKKMLFEQELTQHMDQAIKENQFEIYFQPVNSLKKGKMVSAEALVRWNHPTKGFISPGLFIPLFEKNGFITELDFYVWDRVCAQIKEWLEKFDYVVPVSINISRIDTYNPKMVEYIVSLIEKYDISPEYLKLEVTESAYTDNPENLLKLTKKLQGLGFLVLMDDFGSGFSSLNVLKDFPVDVLKIDLRFLFDFKSRGRGANILTTVVKMSQLLKMDTIVEGVETDEQLEFMRNIGCDSIQGYYFDKPLPKAIFEERLKNPENNYKSEIIEIDKDFETAELMSNEEIFMRLINDVSIAFGLFGYCPEEKMLKPINVNDNYYKILEMDPYRTFKEKMNFFDLFFSEDRTLVINCCDRTIKTRNKEKFITFIKKGNGQKLFASIDIQYVHRTETYYMISLMLNDIGDTEGLKKFSDR